MLNDLLLRLRSLFRRKDVEAEVDEELRFHFEQQVAKFIQSGLPPQEAKRRARLEFGGMEQLKAEHRDARGVTFIETLLQDIRYGLRMLGKSTGFTVVAVLTLALGIGANTAIFSYINAWIIKPLPYPQADRLMVFQSHDKKNGWTSEHVTSRADFFDFQKQNTSFEQTVAWTGTNFNLTGDGPPALVEGGRVSWNYFDTLGAKPILGRTFTPDDDRSGAPHVAILGKGLWQSRYAGDPKIIGRSIAIGGEAYTVVGVMPGTFQFPLMGLANLWTPLALTDTQRVDRGSTWLPAFGRLRPGVTPKQAQAETAVFFAGLEKQFPQTNTNLTWLLSSMTWDIRRKEGAPELMICLSVVALILLIACANVANLMLARSTSRAKEFAVRGALGATEGRLARQLLTESLLLFFFGGVAGTLFGLWGMKLIESWIPGHIRGYLVNYGHADLDFTTLVVKSFIISVRSSPGYNPANIMVAQLALPKARYTQESQLRNFNEEVLARIRALPQVDSAGVASNVPFGGFGQGVEFEAVGKPAPQAGERQGTHFTAVSVDYFSTMQIGLVKGRLFTAADAQGSSPSVIINQTMAGQIWPGADPIGKQLRFGDQHTVGTIVGVLNDIKMNRLRPRPERQMYVPLAQFPSATLGFVVRTAGDSTAMATAVRDTIWIVDRDQPISSVEPLETLMVIVDAGNRVLTKLMVFFGVLAMFLGVIGIYGVMSNQVSQRTHEIGIRTALGASPPQVMGMVIGQGLKLTLIGVVIGALGAARALATLLYQVTPYDPLTFISVPIVFGAIAAAACSIPARRAMRVDPLVALRYE